MTKNQESTLSMLLNVRDCLVSNSAIATALPRYNDYYSLFDDSLQKILLKQRAQMMGATKVNTKNKTELRMLCTTSAENLLLALDGYAMITNNVTLKEDISTTLSEYKTAADTVFASQADNLYHIGLPLETILLDYDVPPNFFAAFRIEIDEYSAKIASPRQTIINKALVTADMKNLFLKIKKELADLTTLVSIKKFSEPAFYNKFIASSKIIETAARPYALHISLKDENNNPIPKFLFTFKRLSDNKILAFKTNNNGTIVRPTFKEGPYALTISNINYTPFVGALSITAGKTFKLEARINTIDKTITL
jgi:hypothetical protein